jgi:molybdopterin synthase catalytic subunit
MSAYLFDPLSVLVDGPVDPDLPAACAERFAANRAIGAHVVFLGQVRADSFDGVTVAGIEYTAHERMARSAFDAIARRAADENEILDMVVRHSLGYVPAGQVSLLVAVATAHRDAAYRASRFMLEAIKQDVPIYGREIGEGDASRWKLNR